MRACSATAFAIISRNGYCYPDFYADLLFTAYYGGIAVFDGCCDRGVIDV